MVGGVECDWQRLAQCPRESTRRQRLHLRHERQRSTCERAFVRTATLPAGFGGDLPAGHDAYAVFSDDVGELRFRVYATVDVRVA